MKYRLGEKHPTENLWRVVACRTLEIPFYGLIEKGHIGGWVESEFNLSHAGNCWIHHEAQVSGTASVYDDAQVYHKVQVSDDARVYDGACIWNEAQITGGASVYGKVHVADKARVSGGVRIDGRARISQQAHVSGGLITDRACVTGNARVYQAHVSGNSEISGTCVLGQPEKNDGSTDQDRQVYVYGESYINAGKWIISPLQIQGSRHHVCTSTPEHIRIGCITRTVAEWLEEYKTIGRNNGYTTKEQAEYKRYIRACEMYLKQFRMRTHTA